MSSQFASELILFSGGDAVMFRASVPGAGPLGLEGPAYVLAPYASSVEERTRAVGGLVQGLVETGAIPEEALRNELQVREEREETDEIKGRRMFVLPRRSGLVWSGLAPVFLDGNSSGGGGGGSGKGENTFRLDAVRVVSCRRRILFRAVDFTPACSRVECGSGVI